jgi:hypothetical protein
MARGRYLSTALLASLWASLALATQMVAVAAPAVTPAASPQERATCPQDPAAPLAQAVLARGGGQAAPTASPSPADPPGSSFWDSLQIHGFAAQAVINTSDNRWFGPSDETSFQFTELALNASLRPTSRLLLSAQVLSRIAGEMYDGTPAIDYALADYALLDSPDRRAGLRLGRIKNPLGLYNETRDVPFTHPGIFLPQVVYFDRVRNLVLSSDGGLLYGETSSDFGTLSANLVYGQAVVDDNVEWTYLNGDFPGQIKPDGNSWLGSLWYHSPAERLKLGLSAASLAIRFDPDRYAPWTLNAGKTDIFYWIASIQYSGENWTLVSEYAGEPLDWNGYGPYFPNRKVQAEGYYFQGTWRPWSPIELMVRYQEGYGDREDRDGSRAAALSALSGFPVPGYSGFSKILGFGIRWDIDPHWLVRADWEHHHGTFILSGKDNPDPSQLAEYWDMFGLQLVFRF